MQAQLDLDCPNAPESVREGAVMLRGFAAVLALAAVVSLSGCAPERYRPAPLAADATAASLRARSLTDPGLRAFEEECLGNPLTEWPLAEWDYRSLSLAALYFNPQLEVARARVAESEAQLLTAGARPNPTFAITPGVPSPYLLTLDLSFPLETAGKRGDRLRAAHSLDESARFDLAAAAWSVRGEARSALIDVLVQSRALDLLRAELAAREDQVAILSRMSAAGEISALEVDDARIELSRTRASVASAEEAAVGSRAALAAAIGVPMKALAAVRLSWPGLDALPDAESLDLAQIERDAVLNRLDVRAALARYAAAEADLELEIAKQYPDIVIGPGYAYEEKRSYFTIGLSATLPLFDRNRGPIAEAEAARRKAAAAFLETQADVIDKSARARAVYAAAIESLAEAARFSDLQSSRREAVRRAVRIGEEGRLALDEADVESAVAGRGRLEALARVQHALGDLEEAVQRPLSAADDIPPIKQGMLLIARPRAFP
jgi:cobalt-zinc-cadmium efflux system outer membrane protein